MSERSRSTQRPSSSAQNSTPDADAREGPRGREGAGLRLLLPLGQCPGCVGKTWPAAGVRATSRKGPLPSPESVMGGHSPAAPGGNRRPGARGSAYAPRGRPLTGWCIYPVLTPTPRVWPGGLPGLLCTRGGQPSERTGGSTAGDCKRAKSVTGTLPPACWSR